MRRTAGLIRFLLVVLISVASRAQSGFDLIPLGVYGGGDESNLSAYLLGERDKNEFICLDAGTLRYGINKAIQNGIFDKSNEYVLHNYIKGYFISHGHLDHHAGLIINSPDDNEKPIYGIDFTFDILKNRYFTQDAWINFANEGEEPRLNKYTYKRLKDQEEFAIENTGLSGRIFELSHVNPYKSSALLITNRQGESVLYFGDTGADRLEESDKLKKIWDSVSELVKNKSLKAILIENSYDNHRDENALFGHLTPQLLNEELGVLARAANLEKLSDLKIIITHLKPEKERIQNIKKEWAKNNPYEVQVLFPVQGELIRLE